MCKSLIFIGTILAGLPAVAGAGISVSELPDTEPDPLDQRAAGAP